MIRTVYMMAIDIERGKTVDRSEYEKDALGARANGTWTRIAWVHHACLDGGRIKMRIGR